VANVNVILRPVPDGAEDELIAIELPNEVGVGHSFEHGRAEWTIVGELKREDTELRVRGTGAWLAIPR
jgi:hypothetical protein